MVVTVKLKYFSLYILHFYIVIKLQSSYLIINKRTRNCITIFRIILFSLFQGKCPVHGLLHHDIFSYLVMGILWKDMPRFNCRFKNELSHFCLSTICQISYVIFRWLSVKSFKSTWLIYFTSLNVVILIKQIASVLDFKSCYYKVVYWNWKYVSFKLISK